MGRQALLAVICCLVSSETLAEAVKPANSFIIKDNASAESAPRLYRNVPVGVYASAAPYAALSYRIPAFLSGPTTSASRNVPVKEQLVLNNVNAYLKDSYGNRFVETPQTAAYKSTIPQQYVQLQALPAHFAQPLVAVPPNYANKQQAQRTVFVPHYRFPVQVAAPTNSFSGTSHVSQPLIYAQNLKSWAPSPTSYSQFHRLVVPQKNQQDNKALYTQAFQGYGVNSAPKFQRLEEKPALNANSYISNSEVEFERLKEKPTFHDSTYVSNSVPKFQRLEEKPAFNANSYVSNSEVKFERLEEKPAFNDNSYVSNSKVKFERLEEKPSFHDNTYVSNSEPKFQRYEEKPTFNDNTYVSNSEPKFQPLDEKPAFSYVSHTVPKFKPLEEKPVPSKQVVIESNISQYKEEPTEGDYANLKTSSDTQRYTTIVNGKKTVIEIDTKPSVPLLDLTLLEPLTFDNPVVPQVQHLLPRIPQATYKKLPEFNDHKKPQNQNVKPKKKLKKPVQSDDDVILIPKQVPIEPTVTLEDNPNANPEIVYEINEPNYKETYKEQSLSYNKETKKEPVSYSYSHKDEKEPVNYSYGNIVQKEPVHYSYVSNKPNQNKEAYESDQPKYLIYTFKPEEQKQGNDGSVHSEYTTQNADEESHQPHRAQHLEHQQEAQRHKAPQPQHVEYEPSPTHQPHRDHHREAPPSHHKVHQPQHIQYQEHSERPNRNEHHSHHSGKEHHKETHGQNVHHKNQAHPHQTKQKTHQPQHIYHKLESPRQSPHQGNPQNIEYHEHHHHHHEHPKQKLHNPKIIVYSVKSPRHKVQYSRGPDREEEQLVPLGPEQPSPQYHHEPELEAITHEYEEDIKLVPTPTHRPNAAIQVDPNQHVKNSNDKPHPSPVPHHQEHFEQEQHQPIQPSPLPVIHETSKRIIIQEETPEEMHSHQEQMLAKMLEEEENNEEDFEKAYKDAAIGFPGYGKSSDEIEKDIYNPEGYGVSREQTFNADHNQFQDYQAEGDEFPKAARLSYKDTRDDIKNDYYLDYAVHKPESVADRYKKKKEYYKLFDSYKPEKYFSSDKKEKQKEKYTLAPSFSYNSEPEKEENKNNPYFAPYKIAPQKYQYSFPKPQPRDNSAFASRPYQSYTSKTHFVEPQFQYGFEPIAIPRLLDSELAAMASNNSPEHDKPGMRKKVYKENWYIKKTSTAGGDAAS